MPLSEFALLLSARDSIEADLAKGLLDAAGIPCVFHGADRDLAELGKAVHMSVSHQDVYVPKSAYDQAKTVLEEAWGREL